MKRKKSYLTICIVLLALPLLTGLLFCVKEWMHHEKMEEALESSLLKKITVKTSSIHWIKTGKEILFEGKYFDIKTSTTTGEHTLFIGLFDEEEEKLKRQAGLLNRSLFPGLYKIWFIGLYYEHHPLQEKITYVPGSAPYFSYNHNHRKDGHSFLDTPPPRLG